MISAVSDLRLALRSWAKSPTFTVIGVASIGLGIGANTAAFTLVDQVLLRALPVRSLHEQGRSTFRQCFRTSLTRALGAA